MLVNDMLLLMKTNGSIELIIFLLVYYNDNIK